MKRTLRCCCHSVDLENCDVGLDKHGFGIWTVTLLAHWQRMKVPKKDGNVSRWNLTYALAFIWTTRRK